MRAATSLLATALLLGASVPAFAADITIRDFAGRITLVEGTDGVSVDQVGRYPADFSSNRDSIVVDGGLSSKQRDKACRGESGLVVRINGRDRVPDKRLRDYPALTIAVPQGSTLTVRDSTIRFLSEVDLSTADIDMGGCFDIRLANVDDLRLDKSGSGDVEADNVGTFDISKSGSGDIYAQEVGTFVLEQSGSGDISLDRVSQSARIDKSGSGDIEIDEAFGNLTVNKSGSGDVEVSGGELRDVVIGNSGSGDVDIEAPMENARVNASGSGDIYLEAVSGLLDQTVSGSAELERGDD